MAVHLQAQHEVIALAGFHIKRQEFEPEYDNEAEMIVADMEFNDDDTEVSKTYAVVGGRAQHLPCANSSQSVHRRLCLLQAGDAHNTLSMGIHAVMGLLVSASGHLCLLRTLRPASA